VSTLRQGSIVLLSSKVYHNVLNGR